MYRDQIERGWRVSSPQSIENGSGGGGPVNGARFTGHRTGCLLRHLEDGRI